MPKKEEESKQKLESVKQLLDSATRSLKSAQYLLNETGTKISLISFLALIIFSSLGSIYYIRKRRA